MKRAAYYVRVSTGRQEKEATKESQIDEVERIISEDGNICLPEHKYVDDGFSGELLARPASDKMRDTAKRREFEVLYVYDRGRLARYFPYQEIIIDELNDLGIEFKSLHDINPETAEEKVMQSMQGVFHEYERIKIAERFRRGKLFKARSGKLLGYNACYGYDYVAKSGSENGFFIINQEEAIIVRKIFDLVGNEGYTVRKLIRKLYEDKVYPKKGKKDYWVSSVLSRMLRNKTYIGEHYYNKTEAVVPKRPLKDQYKKVKRSSRKLRPKEDWIRCEVPAIIDKDLFEKTQRQLQINSKYASRNKKHDYLLAGMVKCTCSMSRVGQPGGKQHYYRCAERIYRYPLKPTCKEKAINASVLDETVWAKLEELLTNGNLLKQQAEKWLKAKEENPPIEEDKANEIWKGLKHLDEEEERYLRAYGQGLTSIDIYEKRIREVNQKREQLKSQLIEYESEQSQKQNLPNISLDRLIDAATDTIRKLNFEDKLFIVRKLVSEVIANQQLALVKGYIPVTIGEQNVTYKTINRDRWPAQCRKIDFI